jgi:hypothetical protein
MVSTTAFNKNKPRTLITKGIAVERWSGKAWYPVLCSPYKTMAEVHQFLHDYSWHFSADYPYRIKDFKPKKAASKYVPNYNHFTDWNSDKGMKINS